jgi:hypothetical protein
VLGTTAPGVWEPLPMDHLQQQIVGPLPGQVAALDQRIAALEVTPEPAPVDHALTVDNYSGGFTRIIGAQVIGTDPVRITVSLATTPGPNGAVFADLSAISGSANVWADFAGTLGRVEDALTGTPIHGAALKEVIRRGTVVVCHRDNTDPAHPTLKVDGTEAAGQAGTSLTLASLADVDNAAATAPAGKVLGTTGVGEWGPVEVTPLDTVGIIQPWSASQAYQAGQVVRDAQGVHVATRAMAPGTATSASAWAPLDGAWLAAYAMGAMDLASRPNPLDSLSNVEAPPGTPVGKVLGTTGVGAWGPVDPPSGGGDPRAAAVAAATLGSATLPPEWSAVSWQAGSIVTHEGHLFRATQLAPGGHVPGASTRWERFDLPTVWDKPAPAPDLTPVTDRIAAVEQVVDPGGLAQPWSAATAYQPGAVVSSGGRLYVADTQVRGGTAPTGTGGQGWQALSLAQDALYTRRGHWAIAGAIGSVGVPAPWEATAYPASSLVVHYAAGTFRLYQATGSAGAGDVPGAAPVWRELTLTDLATQVSQRWGRWTGTQAQYDALPTKDSATLYIVTG